MLRKSITKRLIDAGTGPAQLDADHYEYMAQILLARDIRRFLPTGGQALNLMGSVDDPGGLHIELTDSSYKFLLNGLIEDRGGMVTAAQADVPASLKRGDGAETAEWVLRQLFPAGRTWHHDALTVKKTITALNSFESRAGTVGISAAGIMVDPLGSLATLNQYDFD